MFIFAKIFISIIKQTDLPKKTKYHVIASAILMCLCVFSVAQTKSIGGEINHYSKVTGIDDKTVTLSDASMFKQTELPDTVLLVQMTGISIGGGDYAQAGLYEFHIVTQVDGSKVILQMPPGNFNTNELVQMVRVPSYKNARIDRKLTCKPWDRKEGTGGILALMVDDSLTFNADIDVSGLGFRGGKAYKTAYPVEGPCSFNAVDGTDSSDYPDSYPYAGYKGEGAVTIDYYNPYDPEKLDDPDNMKGYGSTWNGGGGGNGKWSGGGGGANGTLGGRGEHQACSTPNNSVRGYDVTNAGAPIAYGDYFSPSDRVFMGGGGGAGTGIGTAGGNGGGIVIIVARKLHFNPYTFIKANGASVKKDTIVIDAGAGGGGAGGSILLSVEDYGDIRAEITGGDGGSVYRESCNNTINSIGTGGGGSGGFMLVTGNIDENLNERAKHNGGNRGDNNVSGVSCNTSNDGNPGIVLGEFKLQLRGFLRNHIYTPNDTAICYNNMVKIRASQPIWGTENNYYWQSSSDGNDWIEVTDANTYGLTYLTFPLTENTYFRRIMESKVANSVVVDISLPVRIMVHRDIVNNITPDETNLCWNNEEFVISGNIPTEGGGGGPYTFEWDKLDGTWTEINNASGSNLSLSLEKNNEIQTYQYRRRVSTSKCDSESNTSVITVYPAIVNEITPLDQEICENTAQQLTGELTGGDGMYDHRWETSKDKQNWKQISDQLDYQPNLNQQDYGENFYRRVVTSASGVCNSASDVVKVHFDRQPEPSEIKITTNNKTGDQVLNYLFTVKLDVQQPDDAGIGEWSSTNEDLLFDTPNQPKTTASNLQFGKNTVIWTVQNGVCLAVFDTVRIEVKDIEIPSGFSPNGDKINDCFRVLGSENASSSELIVFDRYNKVVFESKSFNKGRNDDLTDCRDWWDGRNSSGNELPSGTYFYQLILNGDKVYKGYVVLKR